MTIAELTEEFAGFPIQDFDPQEGLSDPAGTAYRLRQDYDEEPNYAELWSRLLDDPQCGQLRALVIGAWSDEMGSGDTTEELAQQLVDAAGRLPSLTALFFAEVTFEECEISWLEHGNVGPLLTAYPGLTHFAIRGGNGLAFQPLSHKNLRSLCVQTGGLDRSVVQQIAAADLPELTDLEIWTGDESYGANSTAEDWEPILNGNAFPKLRRLAPKNSQYTDELAEHIARSQVMTQLEELDLSMGTFGDQAAEAILGCESLHHLKRLVVGQHFLSDPLLKRLAELPIEVEIGERGEDDGEFRYIEVSE